MKTTLLICLLGFSLMLSMNTFASRTCTASGSVKCRMTGDNSGFKKKWQASDFNRNNLSGAKPAIDMVIKLLRLKMIVDQYSYDDIAIGFWPGATTKYNYNYDSRYLPGINAAEGLSSLSSDNVKLSVNTVPLPKQNPLVIRLDVEATASRLFTFERTELDSIPPIYEIWLMDKFMKDSLDLRANTSYTFNINKSDSASFGSNRFSVVIRENPQMQAHLLAFDAFEEKNAARVSWSTENDDNYTKFTVERSVDEGKTFFELDTICPHGLGYYAFVDKNPINGADLYRLMLIDMNGITSYSNTVNLNFGSSGQSTSNISIYPNPSSGVINLAISPRRMFQTTSPSGSPVSYGIKIISTSGLLIKTANASSAAWQGNITNLSPGTYFITVVNNQDNSVVGKSTFIKL